jgi:CheY-like chemotaxis protein
LVKGPGIPKQEQGELFQRFTTRGGAPGSGLGLAIAKQMVDLMQGSIYFESDPTVKPGTSCIVELPLLLCDDDQQVSTTTTSDQQNYAAAAAALNVNDNNNKNDPGNYQHQELSLSTAPFVEPLSILVVDDIKMNRAILKRRIQKCIAPNCTIQEAATGEQALAICCGNENNDVDSPPPFPTFDVIIVDQYMEEAGGILIGTDVVIAMRRSKLENVVIIGNSGNDLDDKFLAAGADLFWKKPLPSNADIIRQLRLAIEHRRRIPCHAASPPESPKYCDQEIIEV